MGGRFRSDQRLIEGARERMERRARTRERLAEMGSDGDGDSGPQLLYTRPMRHTRGRCNDVYLLAGHVLWHALYRLLSSSLPLFPSLLCVSVALSGSSISIISIPISSD